ncbi:MAG: ComEC/Rec2 family competence protein [Elusimicrobiota bacterium]
MTGSDKMKRAGARIILGISLTVVLGLSLVILFNTNFSGLRKKMFSSKHLYAILETTFLYVGQGDATVIRDVREGGKVMLIDAGPPGNTGTKTNEEALNAGRVYVLPYLQKEGISKIDYVVATHKDKDHIGGLVYILENIDVGTVLDNGSSDITRHHKAMTDILSEKPDIVYRAVSAGELIPFGEDIVCQVIAPLRTYEKTENPENNSSVVIRFTVGDVSFILPGDIEIPAELDLLSYGKALRTTVLKAPHHGSTSSSSIPFLDVVKPEVGVFSCGRYNKYGFPDIEIVRRFEDRGAKIYRTDKCGNIKIITDGREYRIIKEK